MKSINLCYGKLIIGIESTSLTHQDKKRLSHSSVGGVILFTRNFESIEQLKSLTKEIKSLRNPSLPIMVDQEGGRVQRFCSAGFTKLPSLYETAQCDNTEIIKAHAVILAYELQQCGVDLSLTPSLDLYNAKSKVINNRSFNDNPKNVTNYANIYIETLSSMGMGAVIKHFPGHGSITNDTHIEIAENNASYHQLFDSDLYPFAALISSNTPISAVMAAHVLYKNIDDNIPTFSNFWLQEVLRKRLKFSGLIFSDDMGMFAASTHFKSADIAIESYFEAGGDMTLLCNDFNVIDGILSKSENFILNKDKQDLVQQLYAKYQDTNTLKHLIKKYEQSKTLLSKYNLI
jgi:beta-N-acetylhexosaminidase